MPLLVTTCNCGSAEPLVRGTLQRAGHPAWLSFPVAKGKEQTRTALSGLPPYPEVEMLDHFLETTGKWAVILGYDGESCRWVDISHGGPASGIRAEAIVKKYA